jgi:UDP-glucose 4-epimerase
VNLPESPTRANLATFEHALITGGDGFIGSRLARLLRRLGHQVSILDSKRGDDVRDGTRLRPDVIFHLAARTDARLGADPIDDAEVNVLGTIQMLEAARRCGAKVILASTAAVYGPRNTPAVEDYPIAPAGPYGASKAAAESYMRLYHDHFGVPVAVLRFSNVHGPGGSGIVDSFRKATRTGGVVLVSGDGTQTRDFVHVDDVADALLAAATHRTGPDPINVSTGVETSVLDLAEAFGAQILLVGGDPGVPRSCLDPFKARRVLDWVPESNRLDSGRPAIDSPRRAVSTTPGFCDAFIEFDDPWAGTYCKLPRGHDGEHSAVYPKEAP